MFDIGLQELVVIFVIALIVFGPKNLPQLGRSLGRAMREFRRASDEFRSTIETNLQMHEIDPLPATPPTASAAPETSTPTAGDTGALPDSVLTPYGGESSETAVAVEVGEPYLAQRGAKLFHTRDCGWAKRIPEADRTYFKRVADARDAGFALCPVCEPWEPA
ncbi:MAG TPA: Sec-independent protein translocase protein TatB [Methylomirabilota bacterium]|jgi:Tat protein translocase TatB subunit|nr:Sec-independent protein translocase protein TatB [Methylomirabilota bacterium]